MLFLRVPYTPTSLSSPSSSSPMETHALWPQTAQLPNGLLTRAHPLLLHHKTVDVPNAPPDLLAAAEARTGAARTRNQLARLVAIPAAQEGPTRAPRTRCRYPGLTISPRGRWTTRIAPVRNISDEARGAPLAAAGMSSIALGWPSIGSQAVINPAPTTLGAV